MNNRKREIFDNKQVLKETYDLKNVIVLERKKIKEMEVAANTVEVRTQRKISQLQNENEVLKMEIQMLKNKADESFSMEQDREAEISRLQEEIKHVGFRV